MSQEFEPSMLEYARFYGLTRNYLEDDPLQHLAAPHDIYPGLEDNDDLFQIRADAVKIPDERLTIDEDAASLLSSVLALAQQPPSRNGDDYEIDTRKVQRMKVEVPLLRTDPEVDLLHFAQKIVPDLANEFLPLETVDEEADEGLDWPSWCHNLPEELTRKLKAEKLDVTNDALVALQEALTIHDGSDGIFEDVELPYTKVCAASCVFGVG